VGGVERLGKEDAGPVARIQLPGQFHRPGNEEDPLVLFRKLAEPLIKFPGDEIFPGVGGGVFLVTGPVNLQVAVSSGVDEGVPEVVVLRDPLCLSRRPSRAGLQFPAPEDGRTCRP
jgi:hypothetical protein